MINCEGRPWSSTEINIYIIDRKVAIILSFDKKMGISVWISVNMNHNDTFRLLSCKKTPKTLKMLSKEAASVSCMLSSSLLLISTRQGTNIWMWIFPLLGLTYWHIWPKRVSAALKHLAGPFIFMTLWSSSWTLGMFDSESDCKHTVLIMFHVYHFYDKFLENEHYCISICILFC